MSLTFTWLTSRGGHRALRPDGKTGRDTQGGLDRPCGARLHRFLAGWARPAHLPEMEWTHVLLEAWPLRPMVWIAGQRCPRRWSARCPPRVPRLEARRALGPSLERQRRLRRISRGDAAQARRGAARVPRLPRQAAVGQGSRRVRPVHGRAPRPSAGDRAADVSLGLSGPPLMTTPPAMVTSRAVSFQ